MNCFDHRDLPAVGICKHCSKGICLECTTDTGAGIACTSTCVEEVKDINKLISSNKKTYYSQKKNAYFFPLFFIVTGLIFTVYGLKERGLTDFSTIVGIGFLLFGVAYAYITAKWITKLEDDT